MENLNNRVDLVNKINLHEKQSNKYFVTALILCVLAITLTVFLGGYNLISMLLIGIGWTFIFLNLKEQFKKGKIKKELDQVKLLNAIDLVLDDPVTQAPDTEAE